MKTATKERKITPPIIEPNIIAVFFLEFLVLGELVVVEERTKEPPETFVVEEVVVVFVVTQLSRLTEKIADKEPPFF